MYIDPGPDGREEGTTPRALVPAILGLRIATPPSRTLLPLPWPPWQSSEESALNCNAPQKQCVCALRIILYGPGSPRLRSPHLLVCLSRLLQVLLGSLGVASSPPPSRAPSAVPSAPPAPKHRNLCLPVARARAGPHLLPSHLPGSAAGHSSFPPGSVRRVAASSSWSPAFTLHCITSHQAVCSLHLHFHQSCSTTRRRTSPPRHHHLYPPRGGHITNSLVTSVLWSWSSIQVSPLILLIFDSVSRTTPSHLCNNHLLPGSPFPPLPSPVPNMELATQNRSPVLRLQAASGTTMLGLPHPDMAGGESHR